MNKEKELVEHFQDYEEEEVEEDKNVEKDKKDAEPPMKHKLIIYSIPLIILILVIIGIIVIFALKNSSDEDQNQTIKRKGTIKLLYQISKNNFQTEPISEEYIKENEFDLYVEGIKMKTYKNFKFTKTGKYNIEIALYENNIKMDNMFKNIETLASIEMVSNSLDEIISITSMRNTFENCKLLTSISLLGFSTHEVKSMHKLFSGSGLVYYI